jgi:prevent-host-death family protein
LKAENEKHTLPMTEARAKLSEAVGRAQYGNEPTFLTFQGKDVAVIVSMEFYKQARKFLEG